MGDPKGFIAIRRQDPQRRPVAARRDDFRELYEPVHPQVISSQAARCMDCGVPFCHSSYGCPVENLIPDWNDLVYRGRWKDALRSLHATNNFPELTGRLCPAPCETACVLGLVDDPVSIRAIEWNIVDHGFARGWVRPLLPQEVTGFTVAVVGSGPAGLAAAQQLARAGHRVTVFERDDRVGGLLRYGIPDFKLEKVVLDRRLAQLRAEGVEFRTGVTVGHDLPATELLRHDAVLLALGAQQPRELAVPGRDLGGIHLAMDYLTQQNRVNAGDAVPTAELLSAAGRRVLVLGGGDTGSDCVGTAWRQGARAVTQVEILPRPPAQRAVTTPWPQWPLQLRTSHAHEEGGERRFALRTTEFLGAAGQVRGVRAVPVLWSTPAGGHYTDLPGPAVDLEVDLVLLALGFTGAARAGLVAGLGLGLDARGNVATDGEHRTSVTGVFAAGDVRRGASLIVWAIREGRRAATAIDAWLRGARAWAPAQ